MTEQEVLIKVTYNWDRITQDEVAMVIYALPGVQDAQIERSVTDVSSAIRWRVQDNVTGEVKSQPYDRKDVAEYICRGLNTPEMGGRHGVYTNESGTWRRDLE